MVTDADVDTDGTAEPSLKAAEAVEVWTIVVGGGSGRRFGRLKQFEAIEASDSERIIDRSVRVAVSASDGIVVVVPPDALADEQARYRDGGAFLTPADRLADVSVSGVPVSDDAVAEVPIIVVAGGESRSESVRHGLTAVPADVDYVCIHDAARPCATAELYRRVIAAVADGADGAVPAVAVVDTIKMVDDGGWVTATPPRSSLFAVQTPQAFRARALRQAHADGADGSDDASLVEANGGRVRVVEGERSNIKITHPDDLARLAELLATLEHSP